MDYVKITPETVHIGAEVVNRIIYEGPGLKNCAIGVITNMTLNLEGTEVTDILVEWKDEETPRSYIYGAKNFLVKRSKIFTNDNPNETFTREVL